MLSLLQNFQEANIPESIDLAQYLDTFSSDEWIKSICIVLEMNCSAMR